LIDTTLFNVATSTYDGYLVEPTAAPSALYPAAQIIDQWKMGTKAFLIGVPLWLPTDITTAFAFNNRNIVQTFDLWRAKEITTGSYRVGLPGTSVATGINYIRLTFSDASTVTQSFTAVARSKSIITPYQPSGQVLSAGYDDSSSDQPAQFRAVYSGRTFRPYFSVIWGSVGSNLLPSARVWQLLVDAGATVVNHLWSATALNAYTNRATAIDYLERAYVSQLAQGFPATMFTAPGGIIVDPVGGDLTDEILTRYGYGRESTAINLAYNNLPLTTNAAKMLHSISAYNNTSAETTDALRAADILNQISAPSGANSLLSVQWHIIATGNSKTTTGLINAILDDANGRGWLFPTTLDAYLTTPESVVPTAGTISFSSVTATSIIATTTGATDADSGLTATPFQYHATTTANTTGTYSGATSTSATFSGLTPNTSYNFQVGVADLAGNWATSTPTVSTTTLANPPTGLVLSAGKSSIAASWGANANPAGTEYYAEVVDGDNSGWITTTSWESINLSPDIAYTIKVKARNSAGAETVTVSNAATISRFSSGNRVVKSFPLSFPETPTAQLQSRLASLRAELVQLQTSPVTSLGNPVSKSAKSTFTQPLYFGLTNSSVKQLQIFLNTHGFPVATGVDSTGSPRAGSLGHETTYFGKLTKQALGQFQLKNNLIKSAQDSAFGYLGPKTRVLINGLW
jgi:hypothetical protein